MVWNSAGSTLYKAVERHNSEPQPVQEQPPEPCCAKAVHSSTMHSSAPLKQSIDRDMLLIAAVLLILLHEKADTKLILALAFVIFC